MIHARQHRSFASEFDDILLVFQRQAWANTLLFFVFSIATLQIWGDIIISNLTPEIYRLCSQQNTSSRTPGIISDKTRLCWISFLFFTSATSHWVEWEATPKSRELHGMIRSLYGWPPGYVYVICVYMLQALPPPPWVGYPPSPPVVMGVSPSPPCGW